MTDSKPSEQVAQTPPLVVTDLSRFVEQLQHNSLCSLTVAFDNNGNPTVAYSVPDGSSEELNKKIEKLGAFIIDVLEKVHEHQADYEVEEEERNPKWNIAFDGM